jgi:hypothetical protein
MRKVEPIREKREAVFKSSDPIFSAFPVSITNNKRVNILKTMDARDLNRTIIPVAMRRERLLKLETPVKLHQLAKKLKVKKEKKLKPAPPSVKSNVKPRVVAPGP